MITNGEIILKIINPSGRNDESAGLISLGLAIGRGQGGKDNPPLSSDSFEKQKLG